MPAAATTPATGRPLRVRFVMEQHLGHRTYAENLRASADAHDDIAAEWVDVRYAVTPPEWMPGIGRRVLGSLAGRREVRVGLGGSASDVDVYNTQVPAALAGRRLTDPFVVITDVTPAQYDRIADGYGHTPDSFAPWAWWKHRVNTRVFARAAYCVGWSSWVTSSFVDDYGVDADRTVVIPPGVDTEAFRPGEGRPDDDTVRLLFVGGDLHRKGGDLLTEVARDLPECVELVLVTKAEVRPQERVRVVNDLEPNDPRLIELYRSADVFVLPTRAETFGIAAVEASAAGLPVVATDVGGLPDIVDDGTTGFLLSPGDGRGLAAALTKLVDDGALRRRLGAAGRERAVARFDSVTNSSRLLDLARSAAS